MDESSKSSIARASELFEQAIDLDADYADAYALLGIAHADSASVSIVHPKVAFAKAKLAYEKCLKIDPFHPTALSGLAEIAMVIEWDLNKAKDLLDRAIGRNPNDPNTIIIYAAFYMAIGDSKNMAEMAMRGIESDPKSAFIHQVYAVAEYFNGNMDKAEKHNLIALSLSPTFQWAIHERSVILLDSNKFKEAEKLLIQGIKLSLIHI